MNKRTNELLSNVFNFQLIIFIVRSFHLLNIEKKSKIEIEEFPNNDSKLFLVCFDLIEDIEFVLQVLQFVDAVLLIFRIVHRFHFVCIRIVPMIDFIYSINPIFLPVKFRSFENQSKTKFYLFHSKSKFPFLSIKKSSTCSCKCSISPFDFCFKSIKVRFEQ